MTINQAIQQVDVLKPNTYSIRQKLLWLSRLEATVKRLVIDANSADAGEPPEPFTEQTDPQQELLMPAPFDVAYLYWLEAQIHYANEDLQLYNSAMGMFNTVFRAYKDDYGWNHSEKTAGRFRF